MNDLLLLQSTIQVKLRVKIWLLVANFYANTDRFPGYYRALAAAYSDQLPSTQRLISLDVSRTQLKRNAPEN